MTRLVDGAAGHGGSERDGRWKRRLLHARWPLVTLFWASFAESVVVPIPIEVILIPFMIARRHQIWLIATVTMAGCLLGALLGYGVGYFLFESLGRWTLQTMGYGAKLEQFKSMFEDHGFWGVIAVGVIPIPFQVAMLAAGMARYPLAMFLLAAVIARGIRYYGLAALLLLFGDRAAALWQRHSKAVAIGVLLVIALFVFGGRFLPDLFG
jgi:membrane protein YqaA with SNARE-associated domain